MYLFNKGMERVCASGMTDEVGATRHMPPPLLLRIIEIKGMFWVILGA